VELDYSKLAAVLVTEVFSAGSLLRMNILFTPPPYFFFARLKSWDFAGWSAKNFEILWSSSSSSTKLLLIIEVFSSLESHFPYLELNRDRLRLWNLTPRLSVFLFFCLREINIDSSRECLYPLIHSFFSYSFTAFVTPPGLGVTDLSIEANRALYLCSFRNTGLTDGTRVEEGFLLNRFQ
jgi:hypothetical protein